MKVWGLTGGIGMGKTTIAGLLGEWNVKVVDTDEISREATQSGSPALGGIQSVFGPAILAPDGSLRRDELAKIIFADDSARRKLEQILHPIIRRVWQGQIETWRQAGEALAVVVIPLLFETGAEIHFEKVICAACLSVTQQDRLAARGWTPEQSARRIAAQLPIAEKITRSHQVIWTEGEIRSAARQTRLILERG